VLLTPRYGDQPVVAVGPRAEGPHPMVGQRQRLEALLRDLSEDQWQHATRCEGWSVQDVITHLSSTNGFWAFSIQQGLAGEPTEFLAAFDPVASPALLVDQVQDTPPRVTLDQFAESNAALAATVAALDDDGWEVLAEAPPGHLPVRLVADHALWDSWVHERDIVVPLGLDPHEDADEVRTSLRYGAALGRAFAICVGAHEQGSVAIEVTGIPDRFVVEAGADQVRVHAGTPPEGARSVRMDAVELLELVSRRDIGSPEPPEVAWLTAGLATVFDQGSAV
jgi:uncharacterized protein (TIGR03083 family)